MLAPVRLRRFLLLGKGSSEAARRKKGASHRFGALALFPLSVRMAAAPCSPESGPAAAAAGGGPGPRVYFQSPPAGGEAGTEDEEGPVRRQGRVTVKYDRKELRKRLHLEEWILEQLTVLYDCQVEREGFLAHPNSHLAPRPAEFTKSTWGGEEMGVPVSWQTPDPTREPFQGEQVRITL